MEFIKITSDAQCESLKAAFASRGQSGGDEARRSEVLDNTQAIVNDVRERGDAAVAEYTERFDGVSLKPSEFEIGPDEIQAAFDELSPELRKALEEAHQNIRAFHEVQVHRSWEHMDDDGTILGQRVTPIESAGVYVPGGKAFYPSSVLMNIVPAKAAGVSEIIMVSPPSYNGTIHPLVLAAASLAGADRVFRVGGAHAVAALAYGTDSIPAVRKITGPGNIFVTVAKRLISDVADIDKEAGPSEVAVVADGSASPRLAAAELMAQAEHDEEAVSVLFAADEGFIQEVLDAIETELQTLSKADIIRTALSTQGKACLVRSLDEAAELVNEFAPEHLSVQVKDSWGFVDKIRNAGCIAVGADTSVAVGDYFAGSNHILPTGGRARFSSALSADDFYKKSSVISYSPARFREAAPHILALANAEELTAHARAIEVRQ